MTQSCHDSSRVHHAQGVWHSIRKFSLLTLFDAFHKSKDEWTQCTNSNPSSWYCMLEVNKLLCVHQVINGGFLNDMSFISLGNSLIPSWWKGMRDRHLAAVGWWQNSGSLVRIPCRMWRWVRDGWGWVVSGMVCRCSRSLVPTVLRYTWKPLSCQTGQASHVTWPEKNRATVHSCIVFQIDAFHLVKGMAARHPGTSHKLAMVKLLRLGSGSPRQACLVPVGGHRGAHWRHRNYRRMTWFYYIVTS